MHVLWAGAWGWGVEQETGWEMVCVFHFRGETDDLNVSSLTALIHRWKSQGCSWGFEMATEAVQMHTKRMGIILCTEPLKYSERVTFPVMTKQLCPFSLCLCLHYSKYIYTFTSLAVMSGCHSNGVAHCPVFTYNHFKRPVTWQKTQKHNTWMPQYMRVP